jgi:dihydroflavonol-4-reductase
VDGTLRALRAAQASGVRRVVLTSSIAAIMYSDRPAEGDVYTEKDWTDTAHPTATAYVKSKTLAERAAWDFAAEHPEMALTTINPGLVAGRPMDAQYGTSLRVVERFFSGKDPVVPNFGLPVVDVEDVSAMHVAALERPHSAGSRYIAAEDFVMAPQMARWLAEAYPDRRIATRVAPKWLLRALSLFDAEVRTVLPTIDEVKAVSSAKAQDELGIAFTPSKDAILKSAAFIDRRDAA